MPPSDPATEIRIIRHPALDRTGAAVTVEAALKRALRGRSVRLVHDARGKPYLEDDDSYGVSLAHCGNLTLLAVSHGPAVGVDIEHCRDRGLLSLPAHALTRNEQAALAGLPEVARADAFLTYWVRKEAILKAVGVGLALEPALVEVSEPWAPAAVRVVPDDLGPADAWTLDDLVIPGCVAAVAVRPPGARVRVVVDGGALP